MEIRSEEELNTFRISYIGLDLWIWPRKCLSKRKSIRLYERDFYPRGRGHTISEPVVRLEKRDTSACPPAERTTWLYWLWRHMPILNSWDFPLMTHSPISEALCLTHLRVSESRTRRKPSCDANLDASFLWHVGCGFPCHQMLGHELSFNSQSQCISTGAAAVLNVRTAIHTNSWLEWLQMKPCFLWDNAEFWCWRSQDLSFPLPLTLHSL